MSISKLMIAIVLGVALPASALAQQAPAEGTAPAQAPSSVKLDVTDFFTVVDTNKDGSISIAEWKAAGLNEVVFSVFDKDKKNSFTKDTFAGMPHPAAMDANKDGKISLEEFNAFTKDIKAQSGPQGGASGGAPGAAPAGAPGAAPAK